MDNRSLKTAIKRWFNLPVKGPTTTATRKAVKNFIVKERKAGVLLV